MQNRTVILAVVIGVLVGAAGVALLVVTDDDGTSVAADLPRLPAPGAGGERALAADSMLAAVTYKVEDDLPDLADEAPAYRSTGKVDDGAEGRLAKAFGQEVTVDEARGAWFVGEDRKCLPPAGAGPDIAVSCASPLPAFTEADRPSKEDARRIALTAFEAGDFDTSGGVQVLDAGPTWDVVAERRVGGARVVGLANRLSIGTGGRIVGGSGQLATFDRLGDYPLVSVTEGVERLQRGATDLPERGAPAGAEPAIAPVAPEEGPVVTERTITHVELGLMPVWVDTTVWLEPAFLFEVDDSDTLTAPAVIDSLLGDWAPYPTPEPDPRGDPGQIEPAPPSGGGSGSGTSEACSGASSSSVSNSGETNEAMRLEVCASPSRVGPGEKVTFTMKASDPDAAIDTDGCQQPTASYGEEGDGVVQCMALCSKESFTPEQTSLTRTFTHAYSKPGTYRATFSVGSCAPKASSASVVVEIIVAN
jgi:hypothetical protein